MGETRAALPLVKALRARYPQASLLITQMTPTGRAIAQELYPDAQVHYLPYDNLRWMRRFVAAAQPACLLLMETEIWPAMIHACRDADVPVLLVNARLSEKSAGGYRRIARLVRPALQRLKRGGGTKPG